MASNELLLKFSNDFSQDIFRKAEENDETRENAFTELIIDALNESDFTENGFVCSHRQKKLGLAVNGYAINDIEDSVDLFISVYSGKFPPSPISKSEIESFFKRVDTFFKKCCNGYYQEIEEAQPVFDVALRIFEIKNTIRKIRYILLTDRQLSKKIENIPDQINNNKKYSFQIFDIDRIFHLMYSEGEKESIQIDIKNECGDLIPCVTVDDGNPVYTSYLAIVPAKILITIYEKFGTKIFERNIRSFLQVRGSVNKGIRDTILNEPEMFLAYNNGLSATAENVSILTVEGKQYISHIKNFQIVNGAQTTATLHYTYHKYLDEVDPSFLQVPLKLTVLQDLSQLNDIIPKISEYANTQNKIDAADFSSNHKFHSDIESLSRRIRAPATGGSQIETYWYYERVRGQYANDRNREKATSKKLFDKRSPKEQKFDKTELAIFNHVYDCRPYDVREGKQKNYKKFMAELNALEEEFIPDEQYYRDLISKAILYKKTYEISKKAIIGGYRPDIVAYSLALIRHKWPHIIDLNLIWKYQDLSQNLKNILADLLPQIQEFILKPPDGKNISEWCKKKDCWITLLRSDIRIPDELLVKPTVIRDDEGGKKHVPENIPLNIYDIPLQTWNDIKKWSQETGYLTASDRGKIASYIAQMKMKKALSEQSELTIKTIISTAIENGFDLEKSIHAINDQSTAEPIMENESAEGEKELSEISELNELQKSMLLLLFKNKGKLSHKKIYYELVKIFKTDPIKIRSEYLKEKNNLVKLKFIEKRVSMGNLRLSDSGVEYCINEFGKLTG